MLNRRQFIQLGAGAAVTAALYGCSGSDRNSSPSPGSSPDLTPDSTADSSWPTSAAGSTTSTTSAAAVSGQTTTGRTLVVVQLNGGNDALNTLVPLDGRYRDARPTLAVPESQLVQLAGESNWALHPSLEPIAQFWDAGSLALLPGIGFADPDHSHFVSLDRWWRANDLASATGWLGRSVVEGDVSPLYATALGSGAPLLRSELFQPAVVLQPSGFVFPVGLPDSLLGRLGDPVSADRLIARAQVALGETIDAVRAFSGLLIADEVAGEEISYREGGLDLSSGLDLAARLVTGNVGARIVVVSVGGFDTHSNQLATHAALLADLAAGVERFMSTILAAGLADRTMLVTTSEFGRRVTENASGGFDHGAGGLSMMFGPMLNGGVLSGIDLGDQLDGDVRPTIDPRTMYTACLDWLGMDPEVALGQRYDEVSLLR